MYYIHSANLVHRDVKPSNILINSNCKIKLADFGLIRSIKEQSIESHKVTEYVATRWYRAPEILFGSNVYNKKVDIWSCGCVLGELLMERVMFPGKSTINQIEIITNYIGKPSNNDINQLSLEVSTNIIKQIKSKKKNLINKAFKNHDPLAVDLLKKCLTWDHTKRLSALECMQHPYFQSIFKKQDLIKVEQPI